ncbi:helix-hairpin-helix domain-containing protein [Mesobacillus maritimus]|uniref:helix-hairpin-helix domain-containing protein n=1 Tax=Mesobacillus maritimus TaxID=1643336 RepID=UPI00384C5CE6
MIEWLKERKLYLLVGAVLVLFFSYAYFSNSMPKEEVLSEENWLPENDLSVNSLASEATAEEETEVPITMMADIKGAVKKPGVYEVNNGERIINLIEKAGGLQEDADPSAVNFALKVSDEMVVYIPKKGEEGLGEGGVVGLNQQASSTGPGAGKVNLNTATTSELETLPGIGPAKSSAILEYRESNGAFKTIEDLKSISGIGEKTFEKLKDLITVK